MQLDPTADRDRCYKAVASRDDRFDGWFIVGVKTTGIYCRPSCPAPVRPKKANVDFYATPAAAQRAGFRACKRCRPDATPGSPAWDLRADLVGRAMRLIADGVVDRDGVPGLAQRLAVSERHLHRLLVSELGAGPLAIARANRAQTARVLIETTSMKFADVAFAAGFSSIRQFNDTIREVFATSPSDLRLKGGRGASGDAGALTVRLAVRPPFDWPAMLGWLSHRAIEGVAWIEDDTFHRTMRLPRGNGLVSLAAAADHVQCSLRLDEIGDLAVAVERCRRLLDLDADPLAVADGFASDPTMRGLVQQRPGLRVPGTVDGFETLVFAILGQQVSVAAATTLAGRIARTYGDPLDLATTKSFAFPAPAALVDADFDGIGLTTRRAETIRAVAALFVDGLVIEAGADRAAVRSTLLEVSGIGPWTADYVALRALGDPDVLPVGDLIVRRSAGALGLPDEQRALAAHGERWAPWRSYATHHLWANAPTAT